ncbi:MAG: hypothetical protein AAGJ40_09515 [Planctomycetota bacterium]
MIRPSDGEAPAARCPYREMTKDELFMYQVLCPASVKVAEYSRSPIPLRVLQVLSHARSLELFSDFYVWDKASQVLKEPVLVAYDKNEYSWDRKLYILARWGEELETPSVLLKRAIGVMRERLKSGVDSVARQADSLRCRVDSYTDEEIVTAGPAASISIRSPIT